MLRNTMPGNLFDLCAISLPMPGVTRPAGVMLMARHGEDRRLLAVAAAAEAALGS
jgi:aspartyl-tRNA(Asn)/glutamyl-tRNA(Gln) amidotransferase subunit A